MTAIFKTIGSVIWDFLKLFGLFVKAMPDLIKAEKAHRRRLKFKADKEKERLDRLKNPNKYAVELASDNL